MTAHVLNTAALTLPEQDRVRDEGFRGQAECRGRGLPIASLSRKTRFTCQRPGASVGSSRERFMKCTTQPWNIGKLWLHKNRINLEPPYQRESGVWSDEKKQLFIDSIFNGFDVPKLYFHDIQANKGPFGYSVIDGKQRLGAIWDFLKKGGVGLADDFSFSGDPSFFPDGKGPGGSTKFEQLTLEQQEYFRSQTIDVVEVQDADEEDIEELFSRLNNGEPLNAAEKRNAMGGNMIKLVRDVAKDDALIRLLKFSDKRMSYHEIAAKLIRLELGHMDGQGIYSDLKKKFLDQMIQTYRVVQDAKLEGVRNRVTKNLREMYRVFGNKNALINKQSFPQLYYGWIKSIKLEYAHPAIDAKLKSFLESFHHRRIENLSLPEENRDPHLIEFGRLMQQGTNDLQSMAERSRLLTRYFLQASPDVELKDPKRSFNEDERYVIWVRSGKLCEALGCGKQLADIDDMHADHTKAWAKGGSTSLSNAQALCEVCNLKKSDN